MTKNFIVCRKCKKFLYWSTFRFDDNKNLICKHCNSVVFAVTEEEDKKIKREEPSTNYWSKKEPLPIKNEDLQEDQFNEEDYCHGFFGG